MARYNGNNPYINIDGNVITSTFISFEMSRSTDTEEVTAGVGREWGQHNTKLKNGEAKLVLIYDTVSAPTDITQVTGGEDDQVAIIYGPEQNVAGKPKHDQDYIVSQVTGPSMNVEKTKVTWEISYKTTGDPRTDIYSGGTFS